MKLKAAYAHDCELAQVPDVLQALWQNLRICYEAVCTGTPLNDAELDAVTEACEILKQPLEFFHSISYKHSLAPCSFMIIYLSIMFPLSFVSFPR